MKLKYLSLLSLAVGLVFCLSFSCEKDNETKPTDQNETAFLYYEFNSEDFIASFAGDNDFYAIRVTSNGSELSFSKVYLEDHLLTVGETVEPAGEAKLIDLDGKLSSVATNTISEYQFQFWKNTFDFTLIPWDKVSLIAKYSDKLYFSGMQSSPGASIHTQSNSNADEEYFSVKLEGDFIHPPATNDNALPLPMTNMEHCPPFWICC